MELLIPASALDPPREALLCTLCGKKLPREQEDQFVRHIRACSRRNLDQIEEAVAKSRSDYFRTPADPEKYKHFRKGGN